MVDVVANNVMSTSTTPDLSTYMFKDSVGYFLKILQGGTCSSGFFFFPVAVSPLLPN